MFVKAGLTPPTAPCKRRTLARASIIAHSRHKALTANLRRTFRGPYLNWNGAAIEPWPPRVFVSNIRRESRRGCSARRNPSSAPRSFNVSPSRNGCATARNVPNPNLHPNPGLASATTIIRYDPQRCLCFLLRVFARRKERHLRTLPAAARLAERGRCPFHGQICPASPPASRAVLATCRIFPRHRCAGARAAKLGQGLRHVRGGGSCACPRARRIGDDGVARSAP